MRNLPIITLPLQTKSRNQMLEITDHVQRLVAQHQIQNGMAIVCVPHTTAAITINENADPDVKHDMLEKLATLIPHREAYYQHGEGNSDSHVKTSLVGNSVTVLIEGGKLVLGTWQGIQFCEFDGPRQRKYFVKLVSFDPQNENMPPA
jgi:secondary thiamine-phosphate synthase enzyme